MAKKPTENNKISNNKKRTGVAKKSKNKHERKESKYRGQGR